MARAFLLRRLLDVASLCFCRRGKNRDWRSRPSVLESPGRISEGRTAVCRSVSGAVYSLARVAETGLSAEPETAA